MQPVAEIRSQLRSDGLRAQRRLPAEWQVNCAGDLATVDVELLRGSTLQCVAQCTPPSVPRINFGPEVGRETYVL